jgi:hypothetical protein
MHISRLAIPYFPLVDALVDGASRRVGQVITATGGGSGCDLGAGGLVDPIHGAGRSGGSLLPTAVTQQLADWRQALADEAGDWLRRHAPGLGPAIDALRFVVADNLSVAAWAGADLVRLEALLAVFPAIPPPPPWLFDGEAQAHDGETWVVYVDAEGNTCTRPYDPAQDGDAIHYTNGMCTSRETTNADATALSQRTGRAVVVTYNARNGFGPDLLQSIADKADPFGLVHPNPATTVSSEAMYRAASRGERSDFVCHSQGGIILRNALVRAHCRLYCDEYARVLRDTRNPVQAHRQAQRYADDRIAKIHIVTAGGAAWVWPPYANVEHVSNVADPIPNAFGQSVLLDPRQTFRELFGYDVAWLPQNDDVEVVADPPSGTNLAGHSLRQTYLDDVCDCL